MVRTPVVAGQFYAGNFEELDVQLKNCFVGKRGPGVLPGPRKGEIKGIIAPHAGYIYSGACAAWAYKELAEAEFADIYIILGPNHSSVGKSSTMMDDWKTPLGLVRTDKDFVRLLVEKSDLELSNMPGEHSIEVQLPFLQYACKDHLNDIKIVPVLLSNDLSITKFALDLKETILESRKRVVVIVSSDFTHYGPAYGFIPFELDKAQKMYDLDAGAIKLIKAQDMNKFVDYIEETGATICGMMGIAILLVLLPKCDIRLLNYYTSGDISKDYKNAVGYAAMVFK